MDFKVTDVKISGRANVASGGMYDVQSVDGSVPGFGARRITTQTEGNDHNWQKAFHCG